MDERVRFIAALRAPDAPPFATLCASFGISRKTGYKWLARYESGGPPARRDQPPTARHFPSAIPVTVQDAVVAARKAHPHWGPKKLRAWLSARDTAVDWPAASTIGAVLQRNGLIRPRRRRPQAPWRGGTERLACDHPNAVWCIDFKGHFALGDGSRCYPLTVSDGFSRFLLACTALTEPQEGPVRAEFERVFREFGLPARIRSDNGPPFATTARGGLSALAVWWIKLGIVPERIDPGHPEQNGRHERMHKTLKAEATQPPSADCASQQRRFDPWRREYNVERPHEALGQTPPAQHYSGSRRIYPRELVVPTYDADDTVRWVSPSGSFSWQGHAVYVSPLVRGEPVGLRQVAAARWRVRYGPLRLGVLATTPTGPQWVVDDTTPSALPDTTRPLAS